MGVWIMSKPDVLVNFSCSDLHEVEPSLRRYARKLTNSKEDYEDLVQDTLVKAIVKQSLFKKNTSLRSWLLTICHNLAMSRYRAKSVRKGFNLQIYPKEDLVVDKANQSDINTIVSDMTACLDKLSPENKEVLVLNRIRQLNYEEIADLLSIPIGTVRSRLNRAKISLRALLDS